RAIAQLNDPIFLGVVWRSLAWSALCFLALLALAVWSVEQLLNLHGWLGWVAGLLSGAGAALLAFWLFLPVAAMIGTLFMERIALAVEGRFYPWLPPPRGAPMSAQVWDGISVGAGILLLN